MDEQLAKHLGRQLAKVAVSRIAGSTTLGKQWSAVDAYEKDDFLENLAASMATALKASTLQERDDLIKVVAAASGTWSDLAHRVLQMWGDDIGDSVVPTWGPTADNVADCFCHGQGVDCRWCENCGKLTPAVKALLIETQGGKLTGGESPADPKESVYHRVHHLFDLFSCGRNLDVKNVQFRDGDGSTFSMEFQPPEPKARRCPNDQLPMVESWHCDSCGHTERD